jgi:hypothetical protein
VRQELTIAAVLEGLHILWRNVKVVNGGSGSAAEAPVAWSARSKLRLYGSRAAFGGDVRNTKPEQDAESMVLPPSPLPRRGDQEQIQRVRTRALVGTSDGRACASCGASNQAKSLASAESDGIGFGGAVP